MINKFNDEELKQKQSRSKTDCRNIETTNRELLNINPQNFFN